MKTIKSIDGKSLLIGGLLACTVFLAMGSATHKDHLWDRASKWETGVVIIEEGKGYTLRKHYSFGDNFIKRDAGPIKVWPAGWEPIGHLDGENKILVPQRRE